MSTPRTVTVRTLDHGEVTAGEPFWCLGRHADGEYRADFNHQGEEYPLVVDTVQVATASLYQRPFAERTTTAPVAVLEFDASHEFDSVALAGLADSLVVYAVGPLHDLVTRLQLLEGGDAS